MSWLRRHPWLAAGLWAALILLGTSVPGPVLPAGPRGSDKLLHALLYGVLGLLVARALAATDRPREHRCRDLAFIVLRAAIVCALFGAFDEWHQQFFRRSTSLADWGADLAGSLIGALVVARWGGPSAPDEHSRGGRLHGAGTTD